MNISPCMHSYTGLTPFTRLALNVDIRIEASGICLQSVRPHRTRLVELLPN